MISYQHYAKISKILSVNPKGNQSWIFIGRTDAEAESPVLWPLDAKSWFIGKDPDAGKDWGKEKGAAEDEMDDITNSMDMSLSKLQEILRTRNPGMLQSMGVTKSQHDLAEYKIYI